MLTASTDAISPPDCTAAIYRLYMGMPALCICLCWAHSAQRKRQFNAPRRIKTERPKAVFDEANMYATVSRRGMSDIKIGKHFGLSKNPIAAWDRALE